MRCFILSKFYRRNFQFVVIAVAAVVVAGFAVLMSLTQKFLLKLAALLLIIWNELFYLLCICWVVVVVADFFVFPCFGFSFCVFDLCFWFLPSWIFQWTTMIGAATRSVYTSRGAFKMNEIAINCKRFDWGKRRGRRGTMCALVLRFWFVCNLLKQSEWTLHLCTERNEQFAVCTANKQCEVK